MFHLAALISEKRFLCFLSDLSEDKLREQCDRKITRVCALNKGLSRLWVDNLELDTLSEQADFLAPGRYRHHDIHSQQFVYRRPARSAA